jgi:sugar phosphate isomerase/epimerase
MNDSGISRRQFLSQSGTAMAGSLILSPAILPFASAGGGEPLNPPIVVFTKAYQVLNLDFEQSAALTSEAGLNGVDVPVRPKGEVEPEKVADDLPRYAEALRQRKLSMPLLTTAIIDASPPTEAVLRTAKRVGAQFYRIGFIERGPDAAKQIREVRAKLKDLAALNKELGITALAQNHSPSGHTYLGGDLNELQALVEGFDPAQIGVAFDIGHALIVHKDQWREPFERIKPHLKVAYIKDANVNGRWVPFGTGDVGKSGYFKLLREMQYHAPISLHLEYKWEQNGKNRASLLKALNESSGVLRQWLASA